MKSHSLDENDHIYGSDYYNNTHHDANDYLKKGSSTNSRIIDIDDPYLKSHFYP